MPIVALHKTADAKFNFRENKATKVKRAAVEIKVPEITVESIAAYLTSEDSKVVSLIVETLQGTLNSYIRSAVEADVDFDQAKLDALIEAGQVGLEAIANLPRSERNTLTNADLEEFGKVYYTLAQELLGKSQAQATAAVAVFGSRVKKIAGNVTALNKIKGDLETFLGLAADEVIEEHVRALTYLTAKIDEYLAEDITADSL